MLDKAPIQCPFCSPTADRVFYRDAWVIGLWDAFPVTPGHALLVPIRHIPTWFDASVEEQTALMRAVEVARQSIESNHGADGYNIGINSGEAAGQTVFHLHVHVIPRRHGDVPDPRGGIRHVIAEKANYLRDRAPLLDPTTTDRSHTHSLVTGGESDPFLPHLKRHLVLSKAVDIAVAFTLRSGLQLIYAHLQDVLERSGTLRILTGDYLGATDPDALLRLLDLEGKIECRVFQTDGTSAAGASASSFHPKAYLFHHREGPSVALIGSSNLSQSALNDGVEWNYRVLESRDPAGWTRIAHSFDKLFYSPNTLPLTPEWIERYRTRRPTWARTAPATQVIPDPPVVIPIPHSIQQEALAALKKTREEGRRAALVVLATEYAT